MSQIEKNTVPSQNQLKPSQFVSFFGDENAELRVMFVGNSITRHAPKPEIGWTGDWGMAASSRENDYVHLLADKISSKKSAIFCICQVAMWERSYIQGAEMLELYESARNFVPDIIVMRIIENCSYKDFDEKAFYNNYLSLINYLNQSGKAKIILTSSFWKHPGDSIIKKAAQALGAPYVELSDLGELDEMKAIGLFEVNGVAMHPGDLGMKTIADRIFTEADKII